MSLPPSLATADGSLTSGPRLRYRTFGRPGGSGCGLRCTPPPMPRPPPVDLEAAPLPPPPPMRSLVLDSPDFTVVARPAAFLPPPPPMRSLVFDLLLLTVVAACASDVPISGTASVVNAKHAAVSTA